MRNFVICCLIAAFVLCGCSQSELEQSISTSGGFAQSMDAAYQQMAASAVSDDMLYISWQDVIDMNSYGLDVSTSNRERPVLLATYDGSTLAVEDTFLDRGQGIFTVSPAHHGVFAHMERDDGPHYNVLNTNQSPPTNIRFGGDDYGYSGGVRVLNNGYFASYSYRFLTVFDRDNNIFPLQFNYGEIYTSPLGEMFTMPQYYPLVTEYLPDRDEYFCVYSRSRYAEDNYEGHGDRRRCQIYVAFYDGDGAEIESIEINGLLHQDYNRDIYAHHPDIQDIDIVYDEEKSEVIVWGRFIEQVKGQQERYGSDVVWDYFSTFKVNVSDRTFEILELGDAQRIKANEVSQIPFRIALTNSGTNIYSASGNELLRTIEGDYIPVAVCVTDENNWKIVLGSYRNSTGAPWVHPNAATQ